MKGDKASEDASLVLEEPESEGIDRRHFVKTCMGAAALGVGGAAGFGMFKQVADLGDYIVRRVDYWGASRSQKSPAPRGLALIPVRVDGEGFVAGVPDHLDWYRYCGHERSPALSDVGHTDDDVFRYSVSADKLHESENPEETYWYLDRLEQPVHADHFRDKPYGTGASVRWRSQGLRGDDVVTALVLKLDPEEIGFEELDSFLEPEHHLLAFITYCTHFCCVPGYQESPEARQKGQWDKIFCTCHGSVFDPTDITRYSFDLRLPRDAV